MTNKNITVRCPTCNKTVVWSSEATYRPFCSHRCKLVDLGEWANEEKRIAGQELAPGMDSGDLESLLGADKPANQDD